MDPVLLYREFSPAPLFVKLGRDLIKVYFNQTSSEVTVPAMDEGQEPVTATEHTAWHVDVAPNYDSIISGIIRTKYSQDDVEAILCNPSVSRRKCLSPICLVLTAENPTAIVFTFKHKKTFW